MSVKSSVSFGKPEVQSDRSGDPDSAISSAKHASPNTSFRSSVLRSNLTRTHKNRDPLFYYEVEKVMGVGSMGSVVKVKKRREVIGGSARKSLQETFRRERLAQDCMKIPFCGWFAEHCLRNPLGNHEHNNTNSSLSSSLRNILSLRSTESALKPIHDSGRSADSYGTLESPSQKSYDMTFAMKSIHLSRVTDETFVEELRNEIAVLKALDHPHIGVFVHGPCHSAIHAILSYADNDFFAVSIFRR